MTTFSTTRPLPDNPACECCFSRADLFEMVTPAGHKEILCRACQSSFADEIQSALRASAVQRAASASEVV